jgi:catalase
VPHLIAADATKVRAAPASFADHTGQPRLFWLSLSLVEQQHTIQAFTFELGKCYESAIRNRMLGVLANVDAELCAGVATGLGMPAPAATMALADVQPSLALSQVGRRWPTEGRIVGIIADEESDLAGVRTVRDAVQQGGMVPLIIAPHGGIIGSGDDALVVQRIFLPAHRNGLIDPRVSLMLAEAFRHAKAIGGWGAAEQALALAGCATDTPGVVFGEEPAVVLERVVQLLGEHRVWARFPA